MTKEDLTAYYDMVGKTKPNFDISTATGIMLSHRGEQANGKEVLESGFRFMRSGRYVIKCFASGQNAAQNVHSFDFEESNAAKYQPAATVGRAYDESYVQERENAAVERYKQALFMETLSKDMAEIKKALATKTKKDDTDVLEQMAKTAAIFLPMFGEKKNELNQPFSIDPNQYQSEVKVSQPPTPRKPAEMGEDFAKYLTETDTTDAQN